ncbi:O-antigen ligase family protein [Vibrio mimicus]
MILNNAKLDIAFIILFPISFILKLMGFLGYFPLWDLADKAITIVALFYSALLLISNISKVNLYIWLARFSTVIVLLSILISIFLSERWALFDDIHRQIGPYYFVIFIFYLIFLISGMVGNVNTEVNFSITFWMYSLSVILIFFNATSSLTLDFSKIPENSSIGMYLVLGDLFSIISLYLIVNANNDNNKVILFIFSVCALILINSRSSLFVFIISAFVYFCLFLENNKAVIFKLIFASVVFIGLLLFIREDFLDSFQSTRIFTLVSGQFDKSTYERDLLYEYGISSIKSSFFTGDLASQIEFSNIGGYIHNILSYWRQFGLLVFLFIVVMSIFSMFSFYKNKKHQYFSMALFVILSLFVSRSFIVPYIWYFIGLYLRKKI